MFELVVYFDDSGTDGGHSDRSIGLLRRKETSVG